MEIEVMDKDKRSKRIGETIKRWRQAKKDLNKRADDLTSEADRIQRANPRRAEKLRDRSRSLRAEASRMTTEAKKGMSGEKLRRSAVLAEIALILDKVKKQ